MMEKLDASHLEPWLTEALEEAKAIMHERGAKYGPGNIAEFGELGVLVRLSDKFARLKNQSKDFADESIIDTYMDIIGYALIGIAWKRGDWPGSEKPEEPSRMVTPELVLERQGEAYDDCCENCGEYRSKHKGADHPFISEEQ